MDYDTKAVAKSSYKVNTETDRNRLYNRDVLKAEQSKRIKKEREQKKNEKFQSKGVLKF